MDWRRFQGISLICLAVVASPAGAQEKLLLSPVPEAALADADMPAVDLDVELQRRYVSLDQEVLESQVLEPAMKGETPGPVPLTLPDGEVVRLVTEKPDDVAAEVDPVSGEAQLASWSATIEGVPLSRALFISETDGTLIGNIIINSRRYELRSEASGGNDAEYFIREPATEADQSEAAEPLVVESSEEVIVDGPVSSPDLPSDYISQIDLMVLYTPRAASKFEAKQESIVSQIELATKEINVALERQKIPVQFNVVHKEEVSFPDDRPIDRFPSNTLEIDTDLELLHGRTDGVLDEVHALRAEHKADLVSLWVAGKPGTTCGNATILINEDQAFADQAFSIVSAECATQRYSFAHELSHNMGAAHQNSDEPGRFPYSHGYVGENTRTVESSTTGCSDCFRAIVWSDPTYNLNGMSWGMPDLADNRTTFIRTGPFVEGLNELMSSYRAEIADSVPVATVGEVIEVAADEPSTSSTDNPVLDVLVLRATSVTDEQDALSDRIALVFAETNRSFVDSGINARVRLAAAVQLNVLPAVMRGHNTASLIGLLANPTDGWLDQVYTLRRQYNADLVTLWVPEAGQSSGACAISMMYDGTPNKAFSVVTEECLSNWSFAHSIGHNLGARHELAADPTLEPFPHGHGYVNVEEGWKDIMSYGVECSPTPCVRRGVWSGRAIGTDRLGADNASVLNETAPIVANYSDRLAEAVSAEYP